METLSTAPVFGAQRAWTASTKAAQRYLRVLLAIGVGNTAAIFVAPMLAIKALDAFQPGTAPKLLGGVSIPLLIVTMVLFLPLLSVYWRWFSKTLVVSALAVDSEGVGLEFLGGKVELIPWPCVRSLTLYRDSRDDSRFIAITYRPKKGSAATNTVHLPLDLFDLDGVWECMGILAPAGTALRHASIPFSSLPRAAAFASVLTVSLVTGAIVASCLLF